MTRRHGDTEQTLQNPRVPVSPRPRVSDSVWRVFCAIEFPDDVRSQLFNHIRRLREAVPQNEASWSRPENIHLTLKFFGDVEQNQIPRISAAATKAVAECSSFQIRISGTGAFPARGGPRVLWIGVDDAPGKLASLQIQLENECAQEGFARETRSFNPHLTLARLRKPQGAKALTEVHKSLGFQEVFVSVSELVLFRSELSSAGSNYTVISRHPISSHRSTPMTQIRP